MWSFASRTPSEVRALTAAPSSPALASASALLVGSKEPYLRTMVRPFPELLEHSFPECSYVLEDLAHNSPASHVVGEDESGEKEEGFQCTSLFTQG